MLDSNRALVIGLVGGIGSGKSRVADLLARRGARVINADHLGHQALRQPAIRARVVSRWGSDLLDQDGEIQRKRLAAIVFGDPAERQALEEIVHPWITARIREEVEEARHNPQVLLVVLDAAILLEAGWRAVCDVVVFVDTPCEERLRRLLDQRGWTAKEVQAREAAQLPLTEKRSLADHVIDNSATLEDLDRQVDCLLRLWRPGSEPVASHPGAEPGSEPVRGIRV